MDENNENVRIVDFGFTTMTEEEIKKQERENVNLANQEAINSKQKLIELKQMIWPLLEQLRKDPAKEVIKWPNRHAVITSLMQKIEDHVS